MSPTKPHTSPIVITSIIRIYTYIHPNQYTDFVLRTRNDTVKLPVIQDLNVYQKKNILSEKLKLFRTYKLYFRINKSLHPFHLNKYKQMRLNLKELRKFNVYKNYINVN